MWICCPVDSSYLIAKSFLSPSFDTTITHVNKTRNQIPGTNINTYFTMNDTSQYFEASHSLNFGFSNNYPPGKFIRIKNFKVYTVHNN